MTTPPPADDRILVFVPAYRCEAQIGRVLAQFEAVGSGVFQEILVVDNRSDDRTIAEAAAAARRVTCCPIRIVQNRENYGLGGSHKVAFSHAARHGFTHIVVLHGDDQGAIADVLPILLRGEHRDHDACLGSRFAPGARRDGYSGVRVVGNIAFNMLFSAVARYVVEDLGSGLNVFGRSIFMSPEIVRYADDLRFNVYLLLDAIDSRRRLKFFPISWRVGDQVSNVRLFTQARDTLLIAGEYLVARSRFRTRDHRLERRTEYACDEVAGNVLHAPGNGDA